MREWMQRYQDSFIDMMNELNKFIDLTPYSRDTIFAFILQLLEGYKFGLDYGKIRKLTESKYEKKLRKIRSIRWVLNRLTEMNLVKRNIFGRYELTDRGRELIKQLFEV
jgi:repressor of nif and glnA expression